MSYILIKIELGDSTHHQNFSNLSYSTRVLASLT